MNNTPIFSSFNFIFSCRHYVGPHLTSRLWIWKIKYLLIFRPLFSSRTAVFPGDTPFQLDFHLKIERGHNLDLSMMKTTVHIGAHTDAPCHYHKDGLSIEKRDLRYYVGPAQVVEVSCERGQRILPQHITQDIRAKRVLFKTNSFPNPEVWNNDFVALSVELIEFLAQKNVILVGIDTPSVDLAGDASLESHKAIYNHDMADRKN